MISCGNDPLLDIVKDTTDTIGHTSFKAKIIDWQKREAEYNNMEENFSDTQNEKKAYTILKSIKRNSPNVKWTKDEGPDYFRTYEEFVNNDYNGDCEDIASFFYTEVRSSGHFSDNDLVLRIVKKNGSDGSTHHIILVVYTLGRTIAIDNGNLRFEKRRDFPITMEYNLFAIWNK
jgi:predicted transglutaminase-like cysteine proteinase